ncbi:fungal specific transcription factor domain-containing protein [Hirsutella rhossiliensis]|uniref:Fungal specific transcription factor domain-containing protein n=1 Tax=Hirsutella rhossiliensis TaxID=111463 RepID=A0A9P8SIW0_9HYPO|nr:fungal specific transcription factor domain-containing protein [Hirsutella rhossiliensis]KAH0964623.1 fungal specific transcription factor domain-containing protein [Hirsutella rhossiliensis]
MGGSPEDNAHSRSACTECQRRKQKCNRVWPCNHCQKRKVADKCRFTNNQPTPDKGAGQDTGRKRQLSHDDLTDSSDTNPWDDGESGFEALGYTPAHLFSGLATEQRQFEMDSDSCPQLHRTLQVLPPRPYTDSLVQNFLDNVNYHYYIIYPTSFLEDYRNWWAARSANKPLGLQWTCLLLMVCACSAQYTDVELQRKLEHDMGETTQTLTEKYHNAARELHSVIPVGNNHILNVQSLLHSCYWYKSEARFVECWHVLSTAIREAQELGIHQEPVSGPMSEFEREMRRRIWCILDTWDWQISALLSRPMIIDRSDCQVGLPSLKLEGYSPSPLMHMKLQSELITQLSRRFGLPKHVASPSDVRDYQAIIETWMSSFPPSYALNNPDHSADLQRPWIVLHRHYLHTMSFSMLLDPIRAYLAKPMTASSPPDELRIRSDGINYCLRLMSALYGFFDHVYPRDAKFHFVLFCIFDTAAVLCSALMHDEDGSTPRRDDILGAIDGAVAMLKRLNNATKTAKTSYDILLRVSQRVTRPAATAPPHFPSGKGRQRKTPRVGGLATTPPCGRQVELAVASDAGSVESYVSYNSMPSQSGILVSHTPSPHSMSPVDRKYYGGAVVCPTASPPGGMSVDGSVALSTSPVDHMSAHGYGHSTPYLNMTPPMEDVYQPVEFGNITQQELGDLASLWNYESLNLYFIAPQP